MCVNAGWSGGEKRKRSRDLKEGCRGVQDTFMLAKRKEELAV